MNAHRPFVQRTRPAFEAESFDAIMAELRLPASFRRFHQRWLPRLAYDPRRPPSIRRGAAMVPSEALNQLAFERRVHHLWRLGPRAMAEILDELATVSARRSWLDAELERYSRLDPSLVDAVGAPEFAPRLFVAGGER
jgi:hypothetical protein